MISVAVVEDTETYRLGVQHVLETSDGFSCFGAYSTAEDALAAWTEEYKPDVVLMDIELPGISGIEAVRRLYTRFGEFPMMMLTIFNYDDAIFDSLAAGASGYLLKSTPPEQLLAAIRELYEGGAPMSNQIARRVIRSFSQSPASSQSSPAALPPAIHASDGTLEELSKREYEVLALLSQGYLYKEIASALDVSITTIQTYIRRIYQKLHVHTRSDALLKFQAGQRISSGL